MAGQDYTRTITPGGISRINANGQTYIFCKTADRPIIVDIGGEKVVMRAGSYQEFAPLQGQNSQVVLYNTDAENAAFVELVMGVGTYDEKIIRGNVTTAIGIKTGTGEIISDTRKPIKLDVISVPGSGVTENEGQYITSFFSDPTDWNYSLAAGSTFQLAGSQTQFSYNPDVHDGVIVRGSRVSDNATHAIEIDPVTGQFIRDLGTIQDLGQPAGVTRYGNILYQRDTSLAGGIYRSIAGGAWEKIYTNTSGNKPITVDELGNLYIASNNAIVKVSPAGEVMGTVDTGYNRQSFGWKDGNLWAFADANYPAAFYSTDLEYLGQTGAVIRDEVTTAIVGAYALKLISSNDSISVVALETVVDRFAGRAFLACENAWLGPRPNRFDSVRSTANVTVRNATSGNPTVEGELVKLILEWYFGGQVPVTYMDYIHAIRINGSSDINGMKYPPINIQSNGQTFLAAKIPDNFRMVFPISATITIDERAYQ